jgi:chemotaxis protein CheZ
MSPTALADEEDLEALFDRVSAERVSTGPAAPPLASASAEAESAAIGDADSIHQRIGHLTRTLHDALRSLGYDRKIAAAAQSLPDAQDRLSYIATLTGQAAERVLAAVEVGQQEQQGVERDSRALAGRWEALYAGTLSVDEFKTLASDTRAFLGALPARAASTSGQLHEIMMAQDFHDLSGQVIKRVGKIANDLESSLVAILVETSPGSPSDEGFLTGPNVKGAAAPDHVHGQAQVDALLESLGF